MKYTACPNVAKRVCSAFHELIVVLANDHGDDMNTSTHDFCSSGSNRVVTTIMLPLMLMSASLHGLARAIGARVRVYIRVVQNPLLQPQA